MTSFRRSDQQTGGRYVQGGKVELKSNRIGWWERKQFIKSPTDITYVISSRYKHRPDLLAYDLYGRATLQWFILQYNAISDVYEDFTEGTTIILPTRGRLFGEMLGQA